MARESVKLSEFQYRKLLRVFTDEIRKWNRRYPPASIDTLRRATLAGDFFADCPDSQWTHTQLLAAFFEQPAAFRFAIDLYARRCHEEWRDKSFRHVIALDATLAHPWNGLGHVLQGHLARDDEAEATYRRARAARGGDAEVPASTGGGRVAAVDSERPAAAALPGAALARQPRRSALVVGGSRPICR